MIAAVDSNGVALVGSGSRPAPRWTGHGRSDPIVITQSMMISYERTQAVRSGSDRVPDTSKATDPTSLMSVWASVGDLEPDALTHMAVVDTPVGCQGVKELQAVTAVEVRCAPCGGLDARVGHLYPDAIFASAGGDLNGAVGVQQGVTDYFSDKSSMGSTSGFSPKNWRTNCRAAAGVPGWYGKDTAAGRRSLITDPGVAR